jgi:hypothetical protein
VCQGARTIELSNRPSKVRRGSDYPERVTLTEFLTARCLETLESESCRYRLAGVRVLCECESPSGPAARAIRDLELVLWCDKVFGPDNQISRILADEHATHPDYRLEWHDISGRS